MHEDTWRVPQATDADMLVEVLEPCKGIELARSLCGSKATATKILQAGSLTYHEDGTQKALLPNDRLAEGMVLRLVFVAGKEGAGKTAVELFPRRAEILYEDPFLVAANKPAGMLVHSSGPGIAEPTLTDLVVGHLLSTNSPATTRVQAVQRLDVETTGVVLFSKTRELQPLFDALVAGHDIKKYYLAVVPGRLDREEVRIDEPIGRDRHDAKRMRVSPTGKRSTTIVRELDYAHGYSLLRCQLLTGRRHQIRVHLAWLGYPIVGDAIYGGPRSQAGMMLHAARESFTHPVTGERVDVEAPWPERFSAYFAPRSL